MYLSGPFTQLQKYFFVSNWQDWPEEEKAGREEELSRTAENLTRQPPSPTLEFHCLIPTHPHPLWLHVKMGKISQEGLLDERFWTTYSQKTLVYFRAFHLCLSIWVSGVRCSFTASQVNERDPREQTQQARLLWGFGFFLYQPTYWDGRKKSTQAHHQESSRYYCQFTKTFQTRF